MALRLAPGRLGPVEAPAIIPFATNVTDGSTPFRGAYWAGGTPETDPDVPPVAFDSCESLDDWEAAELLLPLELASPAFEERPEPEGGCALAACELAPAVVVAGGGDGEDRSLGLVVGGGGGGGDGVLVPFWRGTPRFSSSMMKFFEVFF